jgi:hypothetical protein
MFQLYLFQYIVSICLSSCPPKRGGAFGDRPRYNRALASNEEARYSGPYGV